MNTDAKKPKQSRPKSSFMLHDPNDMSSLGKFVSTDYKNAANKVASRARQPRYAPLWVNGTGDGAVTTILLRKTKTKDVRVFEGSTVDLKEPKVIKRGTREVKYNRRSVVRELKDRRFTFDGKEPADSTEGDAEP